MYLRAAKADAEEAGIETDGMANSVSELQLTAVFAAREIRSFELPYARTSFISSCTRNLSLWYCHILHPLESNEL